MFSAAVRTMTPCSLGFTRSKILRRRLRSDSGSRLEIPYVELLGTRTTKRPGSDTSWVRRAPLWAIGFLVTWARMVWRDLRTCSIRGRPLPPNSFSSYWRSPRYSTAFFGVPMSTKAASIPGRTFWTLDRYTLPWISDTSSAGRER